MRESARMQRWGGSAAPDRGGGEGEGATPTTGFVYDSRSGLYWDSASGYFWDERSGMYGDSQSGVWYSWDTETGAYTACPTDGCATPFEPTSDASKRKRARATTSSKPALGAPGRPGRGGDRPAPETLGTRISTPEGLIYVGRYRGRRGGAPPQQHTRLDPD